MVLIAHCRASLSFTHSLQDQKQFDVYSTKSAVCGRLGTLGRLGFAYCASALLIQERVDSSFSHKSLQHLISLMPHYCQWFQQHRRDVTCSLWLMQLPGRKPLSVSSPVMWYSSDCYGSIIWYASVICHVIQDVSWTTKMRRPFKLD